MNDGREAFYENVVHIYVKIMRRFITKQILRVIWRNKKNETKSITWEYSDSIYISPISS